MAAVIAPLSGVLSSEDKKFSTRTLPDKQSSSGSENLVCVIEEFIKQKAREALISGPEQDLKSTKDESSFPIKQEESSGKQTAESKVEIEDNIMNEGLQINGITLGGNWDTESTLQKELHIGFEDNKLMNGSSSSSPTSDNNTSSVSTMLESLRSNLSQIYQVEPMDNPSYNVKTESPLRGADFCNDENSFSHQRGDQQQQLGGGTPDNNSNQQFDNIYNPVVTSLSSSTMQRQFSNNPYDTSNMLNNALFSQQQGYPTYPLPVKPEPSSPNTPYQLNPYYLSNTQGIYPPSSMNLNQIDYQGYRLSDMMLPSFGNQDQLKQEKYPTLTPESDPVLTHQLLGLNSGVETDKMDFPGQTDVTGPMRIRRIKRPIPAGPTYPVHLWQFILELLGDHACKDIIAWTGNDLEFKVLNSRELARRWGKRKNKPRMNFDKLSRAMRYYYEKNIIKHIPGQRLVYRFCRNPDDIVFTQLLKTAMGTLPPEARLTAPVTTNPCFASPVDQTPTIPDGYFNSQNNQTMTVTNPFAVKQTVY